MTEKIKGTGWLIPVVIFFCVVFFISWFCPLGVEDLLHCQSCCFSEALYQATASYLCFNPRIGEMLFYLLGTAADGTGAHTAWCVYRLLHPVALTAMLLLAYRLGVGYWPGKDKVSVAVLGMLAMVILAARGDYFWLCGALNWIYPSVLCMLFLLLLEPTFYGRDKLSAAKWAVLLLLTPFVAMGNETVPLLGGAALVLPLAYRVVGQRKMISAKHLVLLVFYLICAALFYLAPGRAVREAGAEWHGTVREILEHSVFSRVWVYFLYYTYLRPLILLAVLLLLFKRRGIAVMNRRLLCCIAAFLVLWLPLFAAPAWGGPRSFYPLDMVLTAALASLLSRLLPVLGRPCRWLLYTGCAVLCSGMIIPLFALSYSRYALYTDLQEKAAAAQQAGQDTLVVREAELRIPTLIPPLPFVPNSIFQQQVTTKERPFFSVTEHEWAAGAVGRRTCRQVFPYGAEQHPEIPTRYGDEQLNKGFARTLGLKRIIYVVPDEES